MYSIGSLAFLLVSFVCYWAYGSDIAPNVIQNLSGPNWAIALAYIAGAAQIVVSFHVSASLYTDLLPHPPPLRVTVLR